MERPRLNTIRERYLQDDLPIRLGGLASNLMRVASVVSDPRNHLATERLLEESKFFIEWTAPDAPFDTQAALVELQILLAVWHRRWPRVFADPSERERLAGEARTWAERVLKMSGLLEAA